MMRKLNIKIWAGAMALILLASSCEDYLNINKNPNQAITADVQLVLPQAIVASAAVTNSYNTYGGHFGGYIANAGGFSGFGTLLSYNLQPGDYNNLWTTMYQDPLRDFKYVIENTEGNAQLAFFNAAAKIMTVYDYMKLVDTFGDIPYSQALRGEEGILAPEYDVAATIYQDLIATLDAAVTLIDNSPTALRLTKASDPLFGPLAETTAERDIDDQMADWKRFANSLKLKMLVRTNAPAASFTFSADGFITDDAIVDPGYELNRPNPTWASWGRTIAGALSNSSRIPTTFSFAFYNGAKLSDPGRGEVIFVNFGGNNGGAAVTATPHNQLGNEVGNPTIIASQVTWAGSQEDFTGLGVLKGPAQGQSLMLLAEAKFLQAEAELTGKLAGAYATTFNEGITASFRYLYKDQAEVVTTDVAPLVSAYLAANTSGAIGARSYLVNIADATTDAQRLEAIITQKYIANLMIASDESYNEFRRTGYPVTVPGGAPALDIASNKSTINDRFDRLPTRVMYPSSEASYNAANYRNVDYRSLTAERIFWDPN
jgi:hypothetical protein